MKKTTRNIIIIVAAVIAAVGIVLAIVLPIVLRHPEGLLYTVTFDSNGGSAVASITDVEYNSLIAEPDAPTKDSHTFDGWFSDTNLTKKWIFTKSKVTSDITLYAKWIYNETSGLKMLVNNGAYTIAGIGDAVDTEDLAIPETYNGLPVTTIAQGAFKGNSTIKTVYIPDNITTIYGEAFSKCENLQSVTLPSGLSTISDNLFNGCKNLSQVEVPASVTTISQYAFYECGSLVSIEFPSSLTKLGDRAFGSCVKLKEVVLPSSLRELGVNVFANCSSIEKLRMAQRNSDFYSAVDGKETNCILSSTVKNNNIVLVVGCQNSVIPSNVTEIGRGAFLSCHGLKSVALPSSLTTIGDEAFGNCTNLARVTMPSSVTFVGDYAFSGCTELSQVTWSKKNNDQESDLDNYNIEHIGTQAFAFCNSLTGFYLPNSIKYIGGGIFLRRYDDWTMTVTTGLTLGNLKASIKISDEDVDKDRYNKQLMVTLFDGTSELVSGLA